jgi:hypothetical protein
MRQTLVDVVTDALAASGADDPNAFHFGQGSACLAIQIVDDLGVEQLERDGFDPETGASPSVPEFFESFASDERERTYDAVERCVDVHGEYKSFFANDTRLSATEADCLASAVLDADLPERMLFSRVGLELDEDAQALFRSMYESCGVDLEAI